MRGKEGWERDGVNVRGLSYVPFTVTGTAAECEIDSGEFWKNES